MKFSVWFLLFLLGLVPAGTAYAAEVLSSEQQGRVTVSREALIDPKPGDSLCVYRDKTPYACGVVKKTSETTITARLEEKASDAERPLQKGERIAVTWKGVTFRKNPRGRRPAMEENLPDYDVGLGVVFGTQHWYPALHVQFKQSDRASFGLMPLFARFSQNNDTLRVLAVGAFATYSYYLKPTVFEALFWQLGGGLYAAKIEGGAITEENLVSPAVFGTLNWRGGRRLGIPFDLVLSAGAEYAFGQSSNFELGIEGLIPRFSVFLALPF